MGNLDSSGMEYDDHPLKAKFPMFTAVHGVINKAVNLQPPRPFRAVLHVSPYWLPLFSLFSITASDCSRTVKIVGKLLCPGYKNLPHHGASIYVQLAV